MGEYALIFQIVGGLLAVFFIFLTVMNTKTWRWLHVTALFLVFAATIAFMPLAAMSTKTQFNWTKAHATLSKNLETKEKEYRDLVYGDPAAPDGGKDALTQLRNEYSRFIVDRGRVLRQCVPALNPADGTVTLQLAAGPAPAAPPGAPPVAAPPAGAALPADAAAPPAAAAPAAPLSVKNSFKPKEIVYAFAEFAIAPDPTQVPVYYIGQFEVTAATDQSLSVRRILPAGPVVPGETQRPWTVFETLPLDMHELFDFPPETREQELTRLFPFSNFQNTLVTQEIYNRMLAGYKRDGQPAEETDPPENVWMKVEFLRDHSIVVDAGEPVSPIDDQNYNPIGQSQVPRLQRGGPVEFKKGDTAVFDYETATKLIADGTAKLGEGQARIFRRRLINYENAFATISRQFRENATAQVTVDRHLAEVNGANEKALEQIKLLEADKTMLLADVAKVEHERLELGKYQAALQAKLAETRGELSRLYNANLQLQKDLKATSDRLTDEIDRRTRAATASSP